MKDGRFGWSFILASESFPMDLVSVQVKVSGTVVTTFLYHDLSCPHVPSSYTHLHRDTFVRLVPHHFEVLHFPTIDTAPSLLPEF